MKKKPPIISESHAIAFIKLSYILIITVGLLGIKLLVYPESEREQFLAVSIHAVLLESIIYSTVICTVLAIVILRGYGLVKSAKK